MRGAAGTLLTLLVLGALVVAPRALAGPPLLHPPLLHPPLLHPPLLHPDVRGASAPDRTFDMEYLRLDLAIDPAAGAVSGVATWTVRRLADGPLVLDQVALNVTDVRCGAVDVPWRVSGDTLVVEVPGSHAEVAVHYRATPRNGLHFRHAGAADTHAEVWSQGEDTDNRFWFPGWDHPNDRFVYDGAITAPAGWRVLTNSGQNLVNYLVMVAAGPYEVHGDEANAVWALPGTSDVGVRRVSEPIPGMMAHFATRTGVPYPWGAYRQVFVQRFLYTGMENTSATVEDRWLVSGPSVDGSRTRRAQSVVAHELAHQWFGDLLTCRSWREMWLNEGFATFFAADWQETIEGPDSRALHVRRWIDASQGGEALAGRFHAGPDAARNTNVYNKGATVLQMLRVMLGEEVFWAGMRSYTQKNSRGLVDTNDFASTMEAASGQELGWFFQQWVELPYVPQLEVTTTVEPGQVRVVVRQNTGDERPLYTLPVEVEIGTAGGPIARKAWLTDEDVEIVIPLDGAPTYVAFDPQGGLLVKVEQAQDPVAWEAQLASPSPYARIVALEALGETLSSAGLARLAADPGASFALRATAMENLGDQRATAVLLPLLGASDDELRIRVAQALGQGVGKEAVAALIARVEQDPNPDVRAVALEALGQLDGSRAARLALPRLRVTGEDQERLVEAAARVLGDHGEVRDLDPLLRIFGPGRARLHALGGAARLLARQDPGVERDRLQERVARAVEGLLDDPDRRCREGGVSLLAQLGDEAAARRLEGFRRVETLPSLKSAAEAAITSIRSRKTPDVTPNALEARLDALEREMEALHKVVEDRR